LNIRLSPERRKVGGHLRCMTLQGTTHSASGPTLALQWHNRIGSCQRMQVCMINGTMLQLPVPLLSSKQGQTHLQRPASWRQ
jgi:hypothetical protein